MADPVAEIVSMGREMWGEGRFKDHPYDETYLMDMVRGLLDNGFAMVIPGIGFFLGDTAPYWFDATMHYAFDYAWYVKPEYRGGRHGLRLLHGFVIWAEQQQCKEVIISPQVEIDNAGAERLLTACGFNPLGRTMVKACIS